MKVKAVRRETGRAHAAGPESLRLSVIIPATNTPPTLERCLTAIRAAPDGPDEIVVVDGPPNLGPAAARNLGVDRSTGDVLVFVDADVEVHEDVFRRIRLTMSAEPHLVGIFGSYDAEPSASDLVSVFRNLLHHHVHQQSRGPAGTFWAGLGAMRRNAFSGAGGFVDHPIEDIELGMRLVAGGAAIWLDPQIQGKHLKRWGFFDMVRTDFSVRGVPWVRLLLERRSPSTTLNLGWRHRLSALASIVTVGGTAARRYRVAIAALGVLVALNSGFYRLLWRKRGPGAALGGVGLHLVHQLTAVAAFVTGLARFAWETRRHRD